MSTFCTVQALCKSYAINAENQCRHPSVGLTDQGTSEARVQKQMRQIADRTVVLADSSKFGKASLVKLCALCDVDQIITDGGLDTDMEQKIKDTGVTLHVVRNGER